jgi:hypothetical protein
MRDLHAFPAAHGSEACDAVHLFRPRGLRTGEDDYSGKRRVLKYQQSYVPDGPAKLGPPQIAQIQRPANQVSMSSSEFADALPSVIGDEENVAVVASAVGLAAERMSQPLSYVL